MRSTFCVVVLMALAVGCGGGGGGVAGGPVGGPANPSALYYVANGDPQGPVAGFLAGAEGNVLFVLAKRDARGTPTQVTGARFVQPGGASWSVFLGSNGLPSHLVAHGYEICFLNYAGAQVDVRIEQPSGASEVVRGVTFDPGVLSRLQAHAFAGRTGSHKFGGSNALVAGEGASAALGLPDFLDAAAYLLSAASCAASFGVGAATAAGTGFLGTAAGAAIIAWGCAGFVLSTINLFTESDALGTAATAVSVAQCQVNPVVNWMSCAGAFAGATADVLRDAERADIPAYIYDVFVGTWTLSGFTVRYPDGRVITERDFDTWNGTFEVGRDGSLRQCVFANGLGGCATGTWDYRNGTFYFRDAACGERPLELTFVDNCMTTRTRSGDCGFAATEEDRWCRAPGALHPASVPADPAADGPVGGLRLPHDER